MKLIQSYRHTYTQTYIYIIWIEFKIRRRLWSVCVLVCVCVSEDCIWNIMTAKKSCFTLFFNFSFLKLFRYKKKKRNGVTSELTSEVRTMMSAKTDASLSPLSLLLSFHILNQLIFVFSFNFFYAFEECITFFYCIHSIQYK